MWNKLFVVIAVTFIVGCSNNSDDQAPQTETISDGKTDEVLADIISTNNLTGDPSSGHQLPSIEDPLPQLGMKLFFSKALGGQLDTACVSCHHPALGGSDELSLPIGVDAETPELLGPGRRHSMLGFHHDGGPTVPRNSPTTFNVGLWDEVIFHDGRIESRGKTEGKNGDDGQGIRTPDVPFDQVDPNAINLAQAQALFPVTSKEEMRGTFADGESNTVLREQLMHRINAQQLPNSWYSEFSTAFNSSVPADELITMNNVAIAISEYERSQVFIDTPWKRYVDGDKEALSDDAKSGAVLFFTGVADGGAGCSSCHSGDFFTDEQFHNIAMPQVGRGKGDGITGDDDFGRFRETNQESDRYAFRTPSLINVEVTKPYGHAGAYTSLEQVIRHHLNPAEYLATLDYSFPDLQEGLQVSNSEANTNAALNHLIQSQNNNDSLLVTAVLTDEEVQQLESFLLALTDECTLNRECLAQWIPDAMDVNHDSLRLAPIDQSGSSL